MFVSVCVNVWSAYLQMNPPLSHLRWASVCSGNSSSGRWRTSTNTDSSAWTRGLKRSSNAETMSYTYTHTQNKHTVEMCNSVMQVVVVTWSPGASRWCCGSLWRPWGPSLSEQHYEQTVSSSEQFSEQCCWTWWTDYSPDSPDPLG